MMKDIGTTGGREGKGKKGRERKGKKEGNGEGKEKGKDKGKRGKSANAPAPDVANSPGFPAHPRDSGGQYAAALTSGSSNPGAAAASYSIFQKLLSHSRLF